MRLILGITLTLVGIGIWSCHIDGLAAPPPTARFDTPWVRTVDGWERAGSWLATPPSPPRLHPLVVAAGQLLLSLMALTLAASKSDRSSPGLVAASGSLAKA